MNIPDEGTIREYYDLRQQLAAYDNDVRSVVNHPNYCLPFMQPGRLVQIKYMDYDFGWGAVVNFQQRKTPKNSAEDYSPQESWIVDVLLPIGDGSSGGVKTYQPLPPGVRPPQKGEKARLEVVPVLLSCVQAIAQIRIILPKELKSPDSRNGVNKALAEVQRRFPDGIALLDPIENMNIEDESFKKLLRVSNLFGKHSRKVLNSATENRSPRIPSDIESAP
jgi:ATP-dependent RNA helicase DOB1